MAWYARKCAPFWYHTARGMQMAGVSSEPFMQLCAREHADEAERVVSAPLTDRACAVRAWCSMAMRRYTPCMTRRDGAW